MADIAGATRRIGLRDQGWGRIMFDETGGPADAEGTTSVGQTSPTSKRAKRRRAARAKHGATSQPKPQSKRNAAIPSRAVAFQPQVIGIEPRTLQITPSAPRLASAAFVRATTVAVADAPASDLSATPPVGSEPARASGTVEPEARLPTVGEGGDAAAASAIATAAPLIDEASLDTALQALLVPLDATSAPDAAAAEIELARPPASSTATDAVPQHRAAEVDPAAEPVSSTASRVDPGLAPPAYANENEEPIPPLPATLLKPRFDLRLVAAGVAVAALLSIVWFSGLERSGEAVQAPDAPSAATVASWSPILPLVPAATLLADDADILGPSNFDLALRSEDSPVAVAVPPSGAESVLAREATKAELAALRPPAARKPAPKVAAAKPPAAPSREAPPVQQVERRSVGSRIADFFSSTFSD